MRPPSLESVRAAARVLEEAANRTPVATSETLDAATDSSAFLKCESFQRTGSFKFRGAFHAISKLSAAERQRGVLGFSSGNHAQALALAGRLHGARVTVVMPEDAPEAKRAATAGYGAEIVSYDPARATREEVAEQLRGQTGATLIPPFDHPDIVSGQGTAALELFAQIGPVDVLLVPCGGGGLLSGSALAATSVAGCRVIGVEPESADDAVRTFRTGTRHTVRNPPTIADGLRTPSLGAIPWSVIRAHVADMLTVTESDIIGAMRFLWTRMKVVVEPSGAVGLAALLANPAIGAGKRVGVILSGGNVDLRTACELFGRPHQDHFPRRGSGVPVRERP